MIMCNWMTTRDVHSIWNKMNPGVVELVEDNPDIWIIINKPLDNVVFDPSRTIIAQMEPFMTTENWGKWADPTFLKTFMYQWIHMNTLNIIEWNISLNYNQLLNHIPTKTKTLSAIISNKYVDTGHIKRVDFVKYIETFIPIDVYGSNRFNYIRYQKHDLPYHSKDDGLFDYKYHFAVENTDQIPNYITEKLIDGILSECLVFYNGPSNVIDWFDPNAFICLELTNFEHDLGVIRKAIQEDEWSKRIQCIRKEKHRILTDMNFFNKVCKLERF